MKETRDHYDRAEVEPFTTRSTSSPVNVISPSSPRNALNPWRENSNRGDPSGSPSGTRRRAYDPDDEKQRYIDAIRARMTQRDQVRNTTIHSLDAAIQATERLRTRNNSDDIAEKLGQYLPAPPVAAANAGSGSNSAEEEKYGVENSREDAAEHRDHVWVRSVSRMFRRKSMEMGNDRDDDEAQNSGGLEQNQQTSPPSHTATGRRRNQISRSERPGAVHMSGRAYGGLPAWARRRIEQERMRPMAASTGQGDSPPIRDPTLPNNMIQVGTENMLPEEANVEEIFNCDELAQVVVDATKIEASEAFDKQVDAKHKQIRKRQLFRASFVCSMGTALIVTASVFLSAKYAPRNRTIVPTPVPSPEPTSSIPSQAPSSPPTDIRRAQAFDIVSSITAAEDLSSDDSPQHRAMDWILFEDDIGRPPSDPRFLQRYIMATFYYATDGENWYPRDGTNFLSAVDECEWFRTTCDENRRIVALDMNTPKQALIGGTLPSEIARLEELRRLSVVVMNVGGTIPAELGTYARKLEVLALYRNQLVAPFPDTFANHTRLKEIYFTGNRNFGGTLPSVLGSMPNLGHVNMIGCNFTGTVPTELGNAINLEKLEISENMLSGSIPSELHRLGKLSLVNLTANDLTGTIPPVLYSGWKHVSSLDLSENRLSGQIPDAVGRLSSGDVSKRKTVDLSYNQFSGPVPSGFGDISRLSTLLLHGNAFTGTVPQAICDLRHHPTDVFFSLHTLEADCATSHKDVGEVECACCTGCYGTNDR